MRFKSWVGFLLVLLGIGVFSAGCGSGGGSGGSSSGGGSDAPAAPTTLTKVSGDNQITAMGESVGAPLVVQVLDQYGKPAPGTSVIMSVMSGKATTFTNRSVTDSNGNAAFSVTVGSSLKNVVMRVESVGIGYVTFTITPRLPFLSEVSGATLDGRPVANLPVVAANIGALGDALVILTGYAPQFDLTGIPTVGDLSGALLNGTSADNMQVLFVPAYKILDDADYAVPQLGELGGTFMAGKFADDLPATTNFVVNANPVILAINGEADGVPDATTLGELASSNPDVKSFLSSSPAVDLEVQMLKADFFPKETDTDMFTYIAIANRLLPVFGATLSLGGVDGLTELPMIDNELELTGGELSSLLGGGVNSAPVFDNVAPLMNECVPSGPIYPIPAEYETVISIIKDEILPISDSARDLFESRDQLLKQLGQLLLDNIDIIKQYLNGETTDVTALIPLITQALPIVDALLSDELSILDVRDQQLALVISDLIPAIDAALPADGIPFGGTSDGIPSTVSDNVLPFANDQLLILQEAMPDIKGLVSDLEVLIPDDGNLLTLVSNIESGGLTTILTDLDALKLHTIDSLQILNSDGIPILYDLLEEAEAKIKPGDLQIEDLDCFKTAVEYLKLNLPSDAVLGDLPNFDVWGPMIAGYLPAEWGNAADVSIFGTIVPAIGQIDIGGQILPAARSLLDWFAGFLPKAIEGVDKFSFLSLL